MSALDQKGVRQLDSLELASVSWRRFRAKIAISLSSKQMINFVREDDTVFCHSMDRATRNLDGLRLLLKKLIAKSVKVRFVKEKLTFNGKIRQWRTYL